MDRAANKKKAKEPVIEVEPEQEINEELFQRLMDTRRAMVDKANESSGVIGQGMLNPYHIATNSEIHKMATLQPYTGDELKENFRFAGKRFDLYGRGLLKVINVFRKEKGLTYEDTFEDHTDATPARPSVPMAAIGNIKVDLDADGPINFSQAPPQQPSNNFDEFDDDLDIDALDAAVTAAEQGKSKQSNLLIRQMNGGNRSGRDNDDDDDDDFVQKTGVKRKSEVVDMQSHAYKPGGRQPCKKPRAVKPAALKQANPNVNYAELIPSVSTSINSQDSW